MDGRQEGIRDAGRQQGRIPCLPEPPQIIGTDGTRGAGAVRRGHPLRRQSQIRAGADRRRASQDRHCRERQDRAAHDDEEGAGVLQGPKKYGRGGKASDKGANVSDGEFSARKRNSVWHGDIIRIPTREERPCLATYLDPSSRKIVEWQASPRINENLAIDALDNAVNGENQEEGLMVHTDGAANTPRAGFAGSSRIAGSSNRFPARAAPAITPSWSRSSRPRKGSFPSIASTTPR